MRFEVNVEKKYFLGLLVLGLILVGVVGVIAYNVAGVGGNPSVFGHSIDEIDWSQTIPSNVNAQGFCINNDCVTNWSLVSGASSGVSAGIVNSDEFSVNSSGIYLGADVFAENTLNVYEQNIYSDNSGDLTFNDKSDTTVCGTRSTGVEEYYRCDGSCGYNDISPASCPNTLFGKIVLSE